MRALRSMPASPGLAYEGSGRSGSRRTTVSSNTSPTVRAVSESRSPAASATRPSLLVVLVWMDLEMTGLDPAKDAIVEIATLITDDQLQVIAEGPDLVIHQPDEVLETMDPVVRDMHTKSGLLEAIRASTITLDEAGLATLQFIKQHVPQQRTVPLCGNSIGMDRRFLAVYLPAIEEWLHYRSVDVSSVKELARRWYPAVVANRPFKVGNHRALDDIRESVAELQYYRERVFLPPGALADTATPAAG